MELQRSRSYLSDDRSLAALAEHLIDVVQRFHPEYDVYPTGINLEPELLLAMRCHRMPLMNQSISEWMINRLTAKTHINITLKQDYSLTNRVQIVSGDQFITIDLVG